MCVPELFIIPISLECKRNKSLIIVTLENVRRNFTLKKVEMERKENQERLQDSELFATQKWFQMIKIILNIKEKKKRVNKF